jgi:hypothetical protein
VRLASLALALVALAVAGCGDDDDETADAPTKEEFVATADGICADADKTLRDAALDQYPEGPPIGDEAVVFAEDVFIPNLQGQHDEIAALTPPAGEEEAVADLLAELQAGIDELAEDPENFVESTALEDAGSAAADFGLQRCGQ